MKKYFALLLALLLLILPALSEGEPGDAPGEIIAQAADGDEQATLPGEQPFEADDEASDDGSVAAEEEIPGGEDETTPSDNPCEHEFVGGACAKCGYVCAHPKTHSFTLGSTDPEYRDTGDDKRHEIIFALASNVIVCDVCDQWLAYEAGQIVTRSEPHVFERVDGNLVCSLCGRPNLCGHAHTEFVREDNIADSYYTDDGNNRTHIFVRIVADKPNYSILCLDCGMVLNTLRTEDEVYYTSEDTREAHDYDEAGVCRACGHVNTCAHVNLSYDDSFVSMLPFDDGNEVYHYYMCGDDRGSQATVSYQCEDCGQWFEEALPVGIYSEKHFFDADGYCVACGHHLPPDTSVNTYEISLDDVSRTNATSGRGRVTITELNQIPPKLYARITWVYVLPNQESFANCLVRAVSEDESGYYFSMVSPRMPAGVTLRAVQVALVTDAKAANSGAYTPLATARK